MSTTSPAIKAILMLVTIVVVIGIFTGLSNPVVQVLLGFADEATLDDGTREKYNYLKDINVENVNSINALLFSINSIAHYNTNLKSKSEKEKFLTNMFSEDQERVFGNQVVKYTFSNIEPVKIKKTDSIEIVTKKIIDYAVRCYYIFEDGGKSRTRCYALDMSQADFETTKITETYIEEQAELFMDSGYCDDKCKDTVNLLFIKGNGKRFDMTITGSMDKKEYYFCAEPGGLHASHTWTPRVYLTDSISHHGCKIDKEEDEVLGFKVTNFHMKQDVGPVNYIEKFVTGYKPNVLYYEMADKHITNDYEANLYKFDIWDAAKWELIASAVFDFIPALKPVRTITGKILLKGSQEVSQEIIEETGQRFFKEWIENIGKNIEGAKGIGKVYGAIKGSFESIGDIFKGTSEVTESFLKRALRGTTAETVEEAVEQAATRNFVKNRFGKTSLSNLNRFFVSNFKENLQELGEEELERVAQKVSKNYLSALGEKLTKSQSRTLTQSELEDVMIKSLIEAKEEFIEENQERLGRQGAEEAYKEIEEGLFDQGSDKIMKELVQHDEIIQQEARLISNKLVEFHSRRFQRVLGKMDRTIERTLQDMTKEEKEILLKEIFDEDVQKTFGSMLSNKKDLQKFISNNYVDEDELLTLFRSSEVDTLLRSVDNIPMNTQFYGALDNVYKIRSLQKNVVGNPLLKKRHIFIFGLYFMHLMEESDAEIFHPVGINSFGYKTSLSSPAIFDDYYRQEWDYSTSDGKTKYNDYFLNYGYSEIPGKKIREEEIDQDTGIDYEKELYLSERYTGTVPVIHDYFVALIKDKRKLYGQAPERFYLISPCKADMNVKVEQIKCHGAPNEKREGIGTPIGNFFAKDAIYETGSFNPVLDETVNHFDGQNAMLYQVDENGDIIKICPKQNVLEAVNPFEKVYAPTSITVDPVLDPSLEKNYCYQGLDEQQIAADAVFNWGIPIAAGIYFGGACEGVAIFGSAGLGTPVCMFVGGASAGIAGTLGYIFYENVIAGQQFHWPYHSSDWVWEK